MKRVRGRLVRDDVSPVLPVSLELNAEMPDACVLAKKLDDLKGDVVKTFNDYEKQSRSLKVKLEIEQEKCRFLQKESEIKLQTEQEKYRTLEKESEIKLQTEQEKYRTLEKESTERVLTLSNLNDALSKENIETKNELRQSEDKVKSLLDDLNMKEIRINELEKDCQKLQEEKSSFSKNFNDRLKIFLSDISMSEGNCLAVEKSEESFRFPDNDQELLLEIEKEEESIQVSENNKRLLDVDFEMSVNVESQSAKRQKSFDPNIDEAETSIATASHRNDDLAILDQVDKVETFEDESSVQTNQTSDMDPQIAHNIPTDNVDANENIAVVEILNPIQDKRRNFRRNIKKIMDFKNLTQETKLAYRQEKERKQHYVHRLQKYNETYYGMLPGEVNKLDKLVLDFDFDTKRELLVVDGRLSVKLKPYQCQGVKFMWDACFESIEKIQMSEGSGCILGHCMGLGKTLQIITLVHTLLTQSTKTGVKTVLIVCPVNVILNWIDEFQMWLKVFEEKEENIKIYELSSCAASERCKRMKSWHKTGGVLIIGYQMFQKFSHELQPKPKYRDIYQTTLINPGADLVVCDEGHLLKNPTSQLSVAMNKIRTLRRIILTGTPMQNNLKEYFSMVEFVKPRLLGTEREFNNRFVGPIVNGQFVDSTEEDIVLMKYRAYILHKLLDGCVQRRDYSVLAEFLPPKQEYVLFIRLTKVQIDLYKFYMGNFVKRSPVADLPHLRKVCNHPEVLVDFEGRRTRFLPSVKTVIASGKENSDEPNNDSEAEANDDQREWWKPIYGGGKEAELSGKMAILLSILDECEARGEKLIVFSGCLSTLNTIEHFLAKHCKVMRSSRQSAKVDGMWTRDVDYLRLDGSVNVEKRKRDIAAFNSGTNTRTRLFLISTKAGSLGINLMAANRVVIFDASWNPSDDLQSIFRTYRIGQEKKCFVYRFVAHGTIEGKIYDRQVSKLSIAKRVIDEHQISRHYKEEDLQALYCVKDLDSPTVEKCAANSTADDLLNSLLQTHKDVIVKCHDHDSLFENMTDETLTDQEVGDIWEEFEDNEHSDDD